MRGSFRLLPFHWARGGQCPNREDHLNEPIPDPGENPGVTRPGATGPPALAPNPQSFHHDAKTTSGKERI